MSGTLREVAVLFLKLGVVSFGRPAAHIALRSEEVGRRQAPSSMEVGTCCSRSCARISWSGSASFRPSRIRRLLVTSADLDGVNLAALGLMAGVTWQVARAAVIDPLSALLALGSLVALGRFKINSAWLIAGGAAVGVAAHYLGWMR